MTITVRRTIPATPEELFDAWLDAESLAEFMRPGTEKRTTATCDPRVGGKFEIIMRVGKEEYPHRGEFRVIERPVKLVFTWLSKATRFNESVVTVEFHKRGKQTEVVLTHTGLPPEAEGDHTKGWSEILEHLQEVER